MAGAVGDIKAGRSRLPACPACCSLSPSPEEAQRARWREKSRRRQQRLLDEIGVDGVRQLWREKSRRVDPAKSRAIQTAARRRQGGLPRVEATQRDRTVVGVGERLCDRCGTPFTPYRMAAAWQRFCSPTCRRRDHASNQVRIRVGSRLRAAVIAASTGVCYLCSLPIDQAHRAPHPLSLSIDHVKPLAMGGTNALDNLRATHLGCNVEKGDQLPPWWIAS